jgi:hypothetical protein
MLECIIIQFRQMPTEVRHVASVPTPGATCHTYVIGDKQKDGLQFSTTVRGTPGITWLELQLTN